MDLPSALHWTRKSSGTTPSIGVGGPPVGRENAAADRRASFPQSRAVRGDDRDPQSLLGEGSRRAPVHVLDVGARRPAFLLTRDNDSPAVREEESPVVDEDPAARKIARLTDARRKQARCDRLGRRHERPSLVRRKRLRLASPRSLGSDPSIRRIKVGKLPPMPSPYSYERSWRPSDDRSAAEDSPSHERLRSRAARTLPDVSAHTLKPARVPQQPFPRHVVQAPTREPPAGGR